MLIAAGILAGLFVLVVIIRFIRAQFAPDNNGRDDTYTDYRVVYSNTAEQTRREYANKKAGGR